MMYPNCIGRDLLYFGMYPGSIPTDQGICGTPFTACSILYIRTVLDTHCGLFIRRGIPEHIRSDNGSEFTAQEVR